MSPFIVLLAAAAVRAGASIVADEAAMVQVQKVSSNVSHQGGSHFGKQLIIEVDAEVFRKRDHPDCKLETDIDKVCKETGFDVRVNGKSLTFVFRPGEQYIRIDGKLHDELLGWSPMFSTRKGRKDEAHHPTEHKITITLRSTGIHTFQFVDGKDPDLIWSKDFHHTRYFPQTTRAWNNIAVKTTVQNKNLKRRQGHYKCYTGYNEVHCLVLRRLTEPEDMTAAYDSSHIPHATGDFATCYGYGDGHYRPYLTQKYPFRGIGTYTFSESAKYGLTVQVFKCPLQRRLPNGGFVSYIAGVAIKMGNYYTISKVGLRTRLITGGSARDLVPDEYEKLPDMTEIDPAPKFLTVKSKVNLQGDFSEVIVKGRNKDKSLTGYAFTVTSFLPVGDIRQSGGACKSNKNKAYQTAVPPEENLFPADDLALLTKACCPGLTEDGKCEPPEGAEPDFAPEDLCGMCRNGFTYAQAQEACGESDDPDLVATCEFDACMECDVEDALDSTGDAASNDDNEPIILGTGGIGTSEADPHCRNVRGESFDIMKMGAMQMVAVPMDGEKRGGLLDITAAVMPITNTLKCAPTTIQRVDIRGSWLPNFLLLSIHPTESGILEVPQHWQDWMSRPDANKGNLTLTVDTWRPQAGTGHQSMMKVKVGPVLITIHQRRGAHTGTAYLDLQVKGLDQIGQNVGGLLGLDNHDDVEVSEQGCRSRDLAVRLNSEDAGEIQEADLSDEDYETMADSMHDTAMEGDGRLISVAAAI